MLVNNTVPEVARDFLLLFYLFIYLCILFYFILFYFILFSIFYFYFILFIYFILLVSWWFFPFYPKVLGGYFHHVDCLICLCSSSIQCMLLLPGA